MPQNPKEPNAVVTTDTRAEVKKLAFGVGLPVAVGGAGFALFGPIGIIAGVAAWYGIHKLGAVK